MNEKYESVIKSLKKKEITEKQKKIIRFAYDNGVGYSALAGAAKKNEALSEIKNLTKWQIKGIYERFSRE